VTGGVPLQVRKLISFKFSIEQYEQDELVSIQHSLQNLRFEKTKLTFDGITASAVGCVLSKTGDRIHYDRKYSIPSEGKEPYHFMPLHPLVLVAYRTFFWKDIVAFVHKHEKVLLGVCANPDLIHDDARRRIFELLVITCCSINADVSFERLLPLKKCNLIETFDSNKLPESMNMDGMYVPQNSIFPAIDLIWKCGKKVCGVLVHVSNHHNVLKKFTEMCTMAGWLAKFTTIYLLYLSPKQSIVDSVQCNIPETLGPITVVALCTSSIPCLSSLQWPLPS